MDIHGGLTGGLFRICEWIYRFACLNLLWLLFTLVGFILFGFGPSTLAMFSIMKKWMKGEDDFPLFQTFVRYYKSDFKQASLIWFVLIVIGAFIVVDLSLLQYFEGPFRYIILGSFATVLILYVVTTLYLFPIVVQYKNSTFQHFKSAIIIGISFPVKTLIMCMGVSSVLFLCFIFPAITFFFLGSGLCFVTTFFSQHLFTTIQNKQVAMAD
ncbi:YesL family protein [Aquibacillus salsiterrae]|uniref:DUF624 domain-containing protein n=1 Tax=Aquibacillus salsiterrae TaxID=2950439 RepID=A0A9X4AG65_9BACI|nr:DUF624 domain-containing protein [Aquibacillus salsiterrae]MDC3416783.1 DUF624 domain-containing protein [Aquibacillus salsiterrae]